MPSRISVAAIAVTLAAFAATEIGLRVLTDRSSRWNVRLGTALRFDPKSYFRLKPNHRLGDGVYTNEYGFLAAPNLPTAKRPGVVRLVYLGDSVTVLPVRGFYPAQVEAMLAARGMQVETLNAAVPGYSSENARALLETELARWDADWFFVYLGWNDLGKYGPEGLPYKRRDMGYELNPVQSALTHVYTLRFVYSLQDWVRRWRPSFDRPLDAAERRLYDDYQPRHFEANLQAILRLAKSRYPRVVAMNLATITSDHPTPSELARAHYPTGMDKNMRALHRLVRTYNESIARVAAQEQVPVIDLYALFDDPRARESFTDSCHLDRAGAARIAQVVTAMVLGEPATPTH